MQCNKDENYGPTWKPLAYFTVNGIKVFKLGIFNKKQNYTLGYFVY